MSRYYSYLNSAQEILSRYQGEEPFATHIKKYFAQYKKFGSRDRKQISHLCYCYFRLGKAFPTMAMPERIMAGLFLCTEQKDELLSLIKPGWGDKVSLPVNDKISLVEASSSVAAIFPWSVKVSEGLVMEDFARSFLIQPVTFIRLRPGKETIVKKKLEDAGLAFNQISSACMALPAASKLAASVVLNKEAVVQDYSSQRVGEWLQHFKSSFKGGKPAVWDCCAASGGKSIMATDIIGDMELTVSDIRPSILANLKKRFEEAGVRNYQCRQADLSQAAPQDLSSFDLVIADVPCTGSGTWSRTPEQLYYFEEEKIESYAALQQKIISNVIPAIKEEGYLLYITCSVFKKENEHMVDFIKEKFHLRLVKMELIKGYTEKADTMFAALLQKKL